MNSIKDSVSNKSAKGAKQAPCEIYPRDKHSISRKQIDPDALKIMYRLIRYGYKAYLVGGGVRDLLLGKAPKDFDIATDATPRRVKDLFRNSRIIGRRFKLIHVFFRGNKIIEVSTFRDLSDPVDPEAEDQAELLITRDNKYGTEETDALRRDITINALFYDLSTFSIIDYVGGMRDLKDRLIRIIGDPDTRLAEDPVRLIRIVRHAVKAGFDIDSRCYASLRSNAALIKKSVAVRVFEELKKDFSSAYALKVLRLLEKTELLQHLLPEISTQAPALLDPEADFSKALELSDQMVADGFERSPTIVLALISLCSRSPALDTLETIFVDADDIEEHVFSGFLSLAVPRKERERISDLLRAWHSVSCRSIEDINTRGLLRHERVSDLLDFLAVVAPDSELLDAVESAFESGSRERSSQSYQRRQRGSGRRQRGSRGRARQHG